MTVKLPLTTHEEKLIGLKMEHRQILHFLVLFTDEYGLFEHPEGLPAAFLIAEAIGRHPVTVYQYLKWLKVIGLINMRRHEPKPRHGKNRGHCVVLLNKGLYKGQRIRDILTTPPNARYMAELRRERKRQFR